MYNKLHDFIRFIVKFRIVAVTYTLLNSLLSRFNPYEYKMCFGKNCSNRT